MTRRKVIFLFRNDLRTTDNAALLAAAKSSRGSVIPLYVFDDRQVGPDARSRVRGLPKAAPLKTKFLLESVEDLRAQLRRLSSDLIIRRGSTAEVVGTLAAELGVLHVFTSTESCSEELSVDRAIQRIPGMDFKSVWTSTMVPPEDLPFDVKSKLPMVYTQFRKTVESECEIKPICDVPRLLPLPPGVEPGELPTVEELCSGASAEADSRGVLPFRGGSTAGMDRLHQYLFVQDRLKEYKKTRNGMLGSEYSSKFSPWLSNGSISPKQVYWEVKRYEAERVTNESTYWLIFELLWRDYFKMLPLRVGTALFRLEGCRNVTKRWAAGTEAETGFAKWCHGETGYDLVDANMIELLKTGFMSNRGRQIVASFLTKDLGCDWRWGAEWFEAHLIDHGVEANWGNWSYSAGVGTDPREDRYFNLRKQAATYDPEGAYVRHWLGNRGGMALTPSLLGLYAPSRPPSAGKGKKGKKDR